MAVAPSAWGALTSAFCRSSASTAGRSPRLAASATALLPAPEAPQHSAETAAHTTNADFTGLIARSPLLHHELHETGQVTGAVADAFLLDAVHLDDAQQEIARGHRLGRERQVASALQLPARAADQDVRNVVVQVLVGVSHVGAVEHQRMVEQRPVAVRSLGQLVNVIGQALDVILVKLRVFGDPVRILGVMRAAVEAEARHENPDRIAEYSKLNQYHV